MPYTIDKPPERIKTLPKKAQEIWISAYNNAYEQYKEDEKKANATAWDAVKNKYEKDKEGVWRAKADISLDQYTSSIRDAFDKKYSTPSTAMPSCGPWVQEIYPTYLIYRDGEKYYKVTYTINTDQEITFGESTEVEKEWSPIRSTQEIEDSFITYCQLSDPTDGLDGSEWEVIICKEGLTIDKKWDIPGNVLNTQETIDYFNDVDVNLYKIKDGFATHIADQFTNAKDLHVPYKAAWIDNVKYVAGRGLMGVLHFLDSAKHLGKNLLQAKQKGHNVYGLSYDFPVIAKQALENNNIVKRIIKFVGQGTVDIVTRPRAGGSFERALAGMLDDSSETEGTNMPNKIIWDMLKEKHPKLVEGKDFEKIEEGELMELAKMAMTPPVETPPPTPPPVIPPPPVNTGIPADIQTMLDASNRKTEILRCEMALEKALAATDLPQPSKDRIYETYKKQEVFDVADVERAIASEKDYIGKIAPTPQPGITFNPTDPNTIALEHLIPVVRPSIAVGLNTKERMAMSLDKLFGMTQEETKDFASYETLNGYPVFRDHAERSRMDVETWNDIPKFKSIREAYIHYTGDYEVSGFFNSDAMRSKMDITSTTFTYALANTLYRRLILEYRKVDFKEDLLISYKKSAPDFRNQEVVNLGYFDDLDDVNPETADYQEIAAITDERAQYAIGQKGNLLTISRKTVINDDVGLIIRLLARFARAAKRTYAKSIWNHFINNTNCTDGTAWFTSGHSNLSTNALGFANALTAFIALGSMTEKDSGEQIGLLTDETVGVNLFGNINLVATLSSIANDEFYYTSDDLSTKTRNALKGRVKAHTIPLLTDTNDWGMTYTSNLMDIIEVSFLNGRQEPELFVANTPSSEQVFVADKIRYKYRYEFNSHVIDYKSGYKSVVA